jgi:hypothetical protein
VSEERNNDKEDIILLLKMIMRHENNSDKFSNIFGEHGSAWSVYETALLRATICVYLNLYCLQFQYFLFV